MPHPMRRCVAMLHCLLISLAISYVAAQGQDASVTCSTPQLPYAVDRPTTTLHRTHTRTEVEWRDERITYTLTGPVPDSTVTEHTELTVTATQTDYYETYTSVVWVATETTTGSRPVLTVFVDPPQAPLLPVETATEENWYYRQRRREKRGLQQYATVVCDTVVHATNTVVRTAVDSIVNSGEPRRTIVLTVTHLKTINEFATQPGTIEEKTRTTTWSTFTTFFRIATRTAPLPTGVK